MFLNTTHKDAATLVPTTQRALANCELEASTICEQVTRNVLNLIHKGDSFVPRFFSNSRGFIHFFSALPPPPAADDCSLFFFSIHKTSGEKNCMTRHEDGSTCSAPVMTVQ